MTNREWEDIAWPRRLANGLCKLCGKENFRPKFKTCKDCGEKNASKLRQYRDERIALGLCRYCSKPKDPNETIHMCSDCRKRTQEYCARTYESRKVKYKQAVFDIYEQKCNCCGETTIPFLSIDHVNNNGNEHRRQVFKRNSAGNMWVWVSSQNSKGLLKKDDFQILCHNCNHGRHINGGICPHQEQK